MPEQDKRRVVVNRGMAERLSIHGFIEFCDAAAQDCQLTVHCIVIVSVKKHRYVVIGLLSINVSAACLGLMIEDASYMRSGET